MEKKWMTTKEVKQYLNCGTTFLYELIKEGNLIPKKVRGKNYFLVSEIDQLVENGE